MDFDFTVDQAAFREAVREFSRREIAPDAAEWDREEHFPREVVTRMAALGLTGLEIPEAYGGQGADSVTVGIGGEEVAAFDFSASYFVLMPALVGGIISRAASDEQKRRWLEPIASGHAVPALALTEPHAGTDAQQLAIRAEPRGAGYVLTGEKTSVSLGASADLCIVFARAPGGITAFVVDLNAVDVGRQRFADLGSRAIGRAGLAFDGAEIAASDRLGEEGDGFRLVMRGFDYSRALIALQCLGVARISLEETEAYAKERSTFGRPIIRNQGVAFPLVEYSTYLEAARLLSYKALWLRDAGRPHTIEANMVKWWGPQLAVEIVHRCLLFHGHYGYSEELPFARRLRDVIGLEIGDGTAEIAKSVVAREKYGRQFRPY